MKMGKFILIVLLGIMMLILGACGSNKGNSSSEGKEKTYEINLNVSASATSAFTKNVAEPWAKYVEEQTKGRVKVNVYSGAALGSQ